MTFFGTSYLPSNHRGEPARSAGSAALVVVLLSLTLVVPVSAFAQDVVNVVHNYAGADAGNWGGAKGAVIGPPDDACANMGAKDKVNLVSNFGFNIPGDARITEVRAYTKAGASDPQTVDVQLASDASVDPPVTIGSVVDYPFPDVGPGNCASTVVSNVGNGLEFWGLVTLAPSVVNSPAFGMVFKKVETSEIKVDSICMQIQYETATGPAMAEGCFSAPFTVNKNYEPASDVPVSVSLECSEGTVIPPTAMAAPGSPAVFSVNDYGPMGSPVCTATEEVPPGYDADQTDCVGVSLLDDGECTIANSLRIATFEVLKDFVDETNPMAVPMTLTCTSGTVTPEMANASEGSPAVFTVTGFDPGATCTATEAPVYGYIPDQTDCQDGDPIADGGTSQCTITNTLRRAGFNVNKEYTGEDPNTDAVSVSLECADGTVVTSTLMAAPGDPAEFEVTGFEGDPNCQATEDVPEGYVGDQSDCFSVALVSDGECTIRNMLNTDQFVVMKTYDEGSDPVSVSLECSDGEVTNSPQDAAPGAAAVFDVVRYDGDPTCTATEEVPPGYDANQDDCQNVALLADGECTISNTLRRATFTVSKVYSGDDPNMDPVSVSLECESGEVTESPLMATPGDPAVFEVTGYDGDPNCTATEEIPYGYDAEQGDCEGVALVADGACEIVNTLRSAEFRVSKVYSGEDPNTDPVSVSLECTDGTVTESPLDAAPEADAVFVVTGYEGEPTCTATEEVPSGYDGDDSNCENVGLLEPGACTITNTLRVENFTVHKEYTDDNIAAVSVSLECASGEVTESPLMAAPEDPAVFEVTGYDGDPNCQATEEVPEGYRGDVSDCAIVPLEADGECTIVNKPIVTAHFFTTKDFSDDNTASVTARIVCDTGLPLDQDSEISEAEHVDFIVGDFEPGTMDCMITEVEVPAGYSVEYRAGVIDGEAEAISEPNPDGCFFENVVGDGFTCEIVNTANPATYTVVKDWVLHLEGGDVVDAVADVTITCDRAITDGVEAEEGVWQKFGSLGDGEMLTAEVDVTTDSATCSASEDVSDESSVEVSTDCSEQTLSAADSYTCTYTNTVFFEGIPTLNQYGLALLALLMLGVGAVGLRRFV